MTQGDTFRFQDRTYTIDLIGPSTTLLIDDLSNWLTINTTILEVFLEDNANAVQLQSTV